MFRESMDKHFLPLCRAHDTCYSLSNSARAQCDKNLKENIEVVCELRNLWFCDLITETAYFVTRTKGQKGYLKRQNRWNCEPNNETLLPDN